MQKAKTRQVRTIRYFVKYRFRRFAVTLSPVLVAIAVFYLMKWIG
ncbi:hypothetical protein [Mangrovibacillus cuniculi]|nr:hypothetical protein [Mangrovibacillus cuniculi]